jgi:hypothetical protein
MEVQPSPPEVPRPSSLFAKIGEIGRKEWKALEREEAKVTIRNIKYHRKNTKSISKMLRTGESNILSIIISKGDAESVGSMSRGTASTVL